MFSQWITLNYFRKASLLIGFVMMIASSVLLSQKGLNLGIDFSGGYVTEFSTNKPISSKPLSAIIGQVIDEKFVLTSAQDDHYWVLRQDISNWDNFELSQSLETQKQQIKQISDRLNEHFIQLKILDSDFLDAQLGKELIELGLMALLTAIALVLVYLGLRFEWRFALSAITALLHDLVFVFSVFSLFDIEFNLSVLASMLAIIGYSLNDSIIVADRIRENMLNLGNKKSINEIIDQAVKATLSRTLITSITTLATVVALWWLAGIELSGFSIALFSGILIGTLSSISIAASLPEFLGLKANYYHQKAMDKEALDKQLNEIP